MGEVSLQEGGPASLGALLGLEPGAARLLEQVIWDLGSRHPLHLGKAQLEDPAQPAKLLPQHLQAAGGCRTEAAQGPQSAHPRLRAVLGVGA